MKSKVITEEKKFNPVTVEITFESEQEIANFFAIMNKRHTRGELLGSLPQYGAWEATKVNRNNFTVVHHDTFRKVIDRIGSAIGWRQE